MLVRLDEDAEELGATVETRGYVGQCAAVFGDSSGADYVGVVLGLSASTVIAICGAIVAWLKWRHPPNNK